MIDLEEVKSIIHKEYLEDYESLQVIRRHIWDVKGIDCGEIKRPNSFIQMQLMDNAYNKSLIYYHNKFQSE